MFHLLMPVLITYSQSIYGWNAMYAAGRVDEMKESAFHSLEVKSAEKCKDKGFELMSSPDYAHVYEGAHYVEHAFVFIRCRS